MPNPYLKRGSKNKGSQNKQGSENKGSSNLLKSFWNRHKVVIIGTSLAVISIPLGVAAFRKMKGGSTASQPKLPMKDLEIVNLEEENSDTKMVTDLFEEGSLKKLEEPSRKTSIEFTETDFEIDEDDDGSF